ncbi:Vps62-related protein [Streptosporangium sp. NPDC051023]|uniref:Vps62-related protein n=1 Tax=Streptosporangium sp. NPDC051023 TaxID=3155410 RepID=UPI00344D5246
MTDTTATKTNTTAAKPPTTMAFGELILTFVDKFFFRYNDDRSGTHRFSCHEPKLYPWNRTFPDGFAYLGYAALPGWCTPNLHCPPPKRQHELDGHTVALCVRLNPDHPAPAGSPPALARPVDLEQVWTTAGANGRWNTTIWRPVPPEGYVAMGLITSGIHPAEFDKPGWSDLMCVREDLTAPADVKWLYNAGGTGAKQRFSAWSIVVPPSYVDDSEGPTRVLIAPNTFTGHQSYDQPEGLPEMRVLCLPLPTELPDRPHMPALVDHVRPASKVSSAVTNVVWLPYTAVHDPVKTDEWKVANSPFYRIERKASWTLLAHISNQTSTTQTVTKSITTGTEKESANTFSVNTGFSVSSTVGVSTGVVSSSATATFSLELGFSHTTSLKELESHSVTRTLQAPPDHAAAMWVADYELQVRRADGTRVGSPLTFRGDSFHYDQYPDDPATSDTTTTKTTTKTGTTTSTGRSATTPTKRSKHS